MILDSLHQWQQYAGLGTRFVRAFRYLESVTASTPLGRQDLDGNDLYAMVQSYATRPIEQCRFEAHRRYVDIQFLIQGRETILWAPLAALTVITQPYHPEKDAVLFGPPAVSTPLPLAAHQFAVFWPTDGHAPGAEWNGVGEVRKVVVKVRVDSRA